MKVRVGKIVDFAVHDQHVSPQTTSFSRRSVHAASIRRWVFQSRGAQNSMVSVLMIVTDNGNDHDERRALGIRAAYAITSRLGYVGCFQNIG